MHVDIAGRVNDGAVHDGDRTYGDEAVLEYEREEIGSGRAEYTLVHLAIIFNI